MSDLSKVIVALDVKNCKAALDIVDEIGDKISFYKVGPVLFIQNGPNLIRELKQRGKKVFLDMKFHDIPNTVQEACFQASHEYKVDMLTIHLSGGIDMAKAALSGISIENDTKIIGVTALTSLEQSDLAGIGIDLKMEQYVEKLTKLALDAPLSGIVCSPHETQFIKSTLKFYTRNMPITDNQKEYLKNFLIINPGVRLDSDEKNDQNRSATPKFAFDAGADCIVIGRPITQARDKKAKIEELRKHLES